LEFETTNNVEEYEALILGLEAIKKLKIQNISVFRDWDIVFQQVRDPFQTNHPRLRQ